MIRRLDCRQLYISVLMKTMSYNSTAFLTAKNAKITRKNYVSSSIRIPDGRGRVLTEDRSENGGFCDEVVEVVVEVMVDPQGQIDHFRHLGDNFRAAAEPCEKVTNVAVVLFDGKGQVFSGEELALGDETVIAFPVIGDEGLAFDADFVEEFLACGVITATKNPGNG